jgi:hypothetical protein
MKRLIATVAVAVAAVVAVGGAAHAKTARPETDLREGGCCS